MATDEREAVFTAWLYAVARYRLIDHYRKRRTAVPLEGLDETLSVEGFEEATSARMDVDLLLSELAPKQSQAIRATHLAGFTSAEAAQDAGIGESDVKISVHRGLKALAARIRGDK